MRARIGVVLLFMLILSGCSSYYVSLTLVNPPTNDGVTFEDELVQIVFADKPAPVVSSGQSSPMADGIVLRIYNKSTSLIKLKWSDAVYVGVDGTTDRLVPSSIVTTRSPFGMAEQRRAVDDFMEGRPAPDMSVPGKARLEVGVTPAANVFRLSGSTVAMIKAISGAMYLDNPWTAKDLAPAFSEANRQLYDRKQIRIILPIESSGQQHNYEFTFSIAMMSK